MLKETRIHLEEEEKNHDSNNEENMLHRKMYLQYTIFYQCNGIKYIEKYKNRIVVYLKKKKKNPKNILTKVSPLGELKYMQHNTIASSMFFTLM